jgi:hypothetical protein
MQDEDSLLPLFEVENGLPAKIEAISTRIKVSHKRITTVALKENTEKWYRRQNIVFNTA